MLLVSMPYFTGKRTLAINKKYLKNLTVAIAYSTDKISLNHE